MYVFNSNAELSWSLKRALPTLWEKFCSQESDAAELAVEIFQEKGVPVCEELNDFSNEQVIRPPGSRRAFYISGKDESVIAIKGTEIVSSDLKLAFDNDSKSKLPNRPWTKFQNFIYREQKAPLGMLLSEAIDEAQLGASYQESCLKHFGKFEEAPLPLFVYRWNDCVVENYINTLLPFLTQRSEELIIPLLREYGMGSIAYYYPYLPTRVRFERPGSLPNKQSFRERNRILYNSKSAKACLKAVDNLISIVARILVGGYLPFSFQDHGVGQCIAPQNVTLRGGICDLGSLTRSEDIKSDQDFYQLLLSLGVILTRSVKELLMDPLPELIYEFDNPSTSIFLLSNFIHKKLKIAYEAEAKEAQIVVDPRITKFLDLDKEEILEDIMREIFP